jgi:starch phosphorylase
VRVDHVESAGVGDSPEMGSTLVVRAFVSLGDLAPADVEAQVVHGRVDAADQLTDTVVVPLRHAESYEGGRHRYDGDIKLERTGPFGYTVRVLPRHELLAVPAELGLVAHP